MIPYTAQLRIWEEQKPWEWGWVAPILLSGLMTANKTCPYGKGIKTSIILHDLCLDFPIFHFEKIMTKLEKVNLTDFSKF